MYHLIVLPDLGQTTSEAKVLKWLKRTGEPVKRGEPLLEVETDKVDMEVEAFVDGYLRELMAGEGDIASALRPVAVITDTPDEAYELPVEEAVVPVVPAPPAEEQRERVQAAAVPAARALARELGIDLTSLTGTGADGLITRKDVERAGARRPLRSLNAMAELVTASKREIPHFYAGADLDVAQAVVWRAEWNRQHPDAHASFNDVFARCCALALLDVPGMNTSWGQSGREPHQTADLRIVAAEEEGLLLVDVYDPPLSPWEEFARAIHGGLEKKHRATAAAQARTQPRLAISNLGMHGIQEFAAIVPPGSTAVVAIGAVRKAAVVREDSIAVGEVCTLRVSADHRVVDGITVAKFLERIQYHLNSL
jgi:pyruvate dehydrogenase E2 component (dihydrolipoamide acetyltransferase)